MKIFLDDLRAAPFGWAVARNVKDCKFLILLAIQQNNFEAISLDHDLGEGEPTGYDLVNWIEMEDAWPDKKPIIHSMNPVGRRNMSRVIERYYD